MHTCKARPTKSHQILAELWTVVLRKMLLEGWDIKSRKINTLQELAPSLQWITSSFKKKNHARPKSRTRNVRFFSFITFPCLWKAAATAAQKAANQMLRMSPAGITFSHICLLTVSNLCLHLSQQIFCFGRRISTSLKVALLSTPVWTLRKETSGDAWQLK